MSKQEMNFSRLYFSLDGRIPRSTLWLKYYLPIMAISIVAAVIDSSAGTFDFQLGLGLVSGITSILLIYPSIAVFVKRFHDRDHSGWFILLMCIPLVNIWPSIEAYFLRGTEGENQYGLDPSAE